MGKKLMVIGGGAAGFFCAVNAARSNPALAVTIAEKQQKVLQKVKVSGGGRCNVTHACFQQSALIKKYPRGKPFLKKLFPVFSVQDTINWFAARGVELHTESDGRIFPRTNNSQTIIDCLLQEAARYKVNILLNTEIVAVQKQKEIFILQDKKGNSYEADFLMAAPGGFPKPEHYQWLQALGHHIHPPAPSLFTFNMPGDAVCKLMGISVEHAEVKVQGSKLTESGPLLITHWGMSGPAILKLSAWGARELQACNYHFNISVNWINRAEHVLRGEWNEIRTGQSHLLMNQKNPFAIPQRLWEYLLETCNIPFETKWSELPSKEQNKLIHVLTSQSFEVRGKTTFKEEFVTCGGIPTEETDANTMESRLVQNLYFGGEILDVDGITGGFNFQHAWSGGFAAAKSIAEKSRSAH